MDGIQVLWGWQPAAYLFLGGMGAGAFIAAMVLWYKDAKAYHRTIMYSIIAAVVCLIVGLLLLLSELINPLRGMMMWQSFSNFSSWMTFGAWVAFAAIVVFLLEAVRLGKFSGKILAHVWSGFDERKQSLQKVLGIVGCVLAFGVAVYTGILLMSAPGIPLWNTVLIPCLFTVSALDTGIALVEIISFCVRKKEGLSFEMSRFFEMGVIALAGLELVVLAILLISMAGVQDPATHTQLIAQESAQLLASGSFAVYFWVLVVAIGLVIPLTVAIVAVMRKGHTKQVVVFGGALSALVGGCTLRFLIVMAGAHADPVLTTMTQLLG